MGADLDVERRLRRRVEPRPDDLAHALGGVAQHGQRGLRTRRGRERAGPASPAACPDCPATPATTSSAAEGSGLRLPRLELGGGSAAAAALEIEQHRGQVDARDPVDERMVGLEDQREAVALEPLDEPVLPQGPRAVELLRGDPRRQLEQLLLGSRRRQRGMAHVVLEVEGRVVDPQRTPRLERRRGQLLAIARDQVQPAADMVQILARIPAAVPRRSAPPPMCMCEAGPLLVQERGVDRGEAVQMCGACDANVTLRTCASSLGRRRPGPTLGP